MKADAGYRFRLYPTSRQAERLAGWGHSCRAVWNVALEQRQFMHAQRGVTLRAAPQCRQLTWARAELDWLADLPAQAAQQVLGHQDRAYDNWWNPDHHVGPPRFKKRSRAMSIPFPGQSVAVRKVSRRWAQVWVPKHNQGRYSRRLRRTIAAIARIKARQARRRRDFTHKLTTDLAKSHGWVGIEDLRVRSMTASAAGTAPAPGRNVKGKAGLNRRILDNAPAERRRQLAYKAARFGSELRFVVPAGTSQTCSLCGVRDPESRPACGRVFACTACGHQAHADLNAAQNIEALAAGRAVYSTRSHPKEMGLVPPDRPCPVLGSECFPIRLASDQEDHARR